MMPLEKRHSRSACFVLLQTTCQKSDTWHRGLVGGGVSDRRRTKKKKNLGLAMEMMEYLSLPMKPPQAASLDAPRKNLINALNEVLLHSGKGAFRQTWFTHWGVNKAAGISMKMKVKGKLGLNINLDQGTYLLTESIFCN